MGMDDITAGQTDICMTRSLFWNVYSIRRERVSLMCVCVNREVKRMKVQTIRGVIIILLMSSFLCIV